MKYEQGELSEVETLELFSELIKTGTVWKLQGHYGRTATELMKSGYLTLTGNVNYSAIE